MRHEPAKPAEAPLEHPAHEIAGADDVGIGQVVADLTAVALGIHDAGGAHDREVLRDVGLAGPELCREAPDFEGAGGEPMEDLEPPGTREDLQDLGLQDGDLVHGLSVRHMRMCA